MFFWIRYAGLLFVLSVGLFAAEEDFESLMDERYAPHAEWRGLTRLADLALEANSDVWWRSPEEVRSGRDDADWPLRGLHLAIDPGHIGGQWAEFEWRHFRITEGDFAVREGELVLEVAMRVRDALVELGAEVSLLRESNEPVNPKGPVDYLEAVVRQMPMPQDADMASLVDYALQIRGEAVKRSVITGELIERARLVNEVIRPDALLSLHINAAPWPRNEVGDAVFDFVDSNHTHVLIFGCVSYGELASPRQQAQLVTKLQNGSGSIELELGEALGEALGHATNLPPSLYGGNNAVLLKGQTPYLWARNLLLLRYVECPVVLLEPYVANNEECYRRIQQALAEREAGGDISDDDILFEYADAVVEAVLTVYGPVVAD